MVAMAPSAAAHGSHSPAALSAGEPSSYSIELAELNGSGSSGVAVLTLADDGSLTVNIEAQGMVPGQPHAQHVHGDSSLERDFTCPARMRTPTVTASSTRWRESSYGEIHIALTTQGDAHTGIPA